MKIKKILKFLIIIFILFAIEGCIDKTSSHQIYRQMIKDAKKDFAKHYGSAKFFRIECGPIILLAKQIKPIRDKRGKIVKYDERCWIYHTQTTWIPLIQYIYDEKGGKMIFDVFLEYMIRS